MIPLYGFLEGDTLGLLVLAEGDDPVSTLAEKLQTSASVRVRPRERMRVLHEGRVLDPTMTVAAAGLGPLDRIDVVREADE
jgi:toluene monooxygenase system protein B